MSDKQEPYPIWTEGNSSSCKGSNDLLQYGKEQDVNTASKQDPYPIWSKGNLLTCDKTSKDLLQYCKEQDVNGKQQHTDVGTWGSSQGLKYGEHKSEIHYTKDWHVKEREYILNVIKKVKCLGKGVTKKDIDPELLRRCYQFSSNMEKETCTPEVGSVDELRARQQGRDETVKQEIKKVIGSLEEVLDELNHVVGDLRTVVTQIDDITTEIEARGSPDSDKKLDTRLPRSTASSCLNEVLSCDSGFMGISSLHQRPTAADAAVTTNNTGDQTLSSATTPTVDSSANESNTMIPSGASGGGTQGHPLQQNNARSITGGPRKTTNTPLPPLCKKCQLRSSNNAQLLPRGSSNNYTNNGSNGNKRFQKRTKHAREKFCFSNNNESSAKVTRAQGVTARNCSIIKSRSISRSVHSDGGDFYETQLEQRLENLSGVDSSQPQGFSTVDWFTLEKRSYSDTLFKGGDNGSDRESADNSSEDEDEAIVCKHKDGVLKASDTFRYKIKQISMRKVNTAHWRVVIQP